MTRKPCIIYLHAKVYKSLNVAYCVKLRANLWFASLTKLVQSLQSEALYKLCKALASHTKQSFVWLAQEVPTTLFLDYKVGPFFLSKTKLLLFVKLCKAFAIQRFALVPLRSFQNLRFWITEGFGRTRLQSFVQLFEDKALQDLESKQHLSFCTYATHVEAFI
ncbi:hypothetical protein EON73_00080 [bacterium]|nr:MAG: hypothetical protein EON73_00080 [bacterium]